MKSKDINPYTAVTEVLKLSENLMRFLNNETAALRARRVADFSVMQEEKHQLINHYEYSLSQLQKKIDEGLILKEEDQKQLEVSMSQVQNMVVINERALKAMNEANNRLVEAVIKAVREKNQERSRYNQKGIQFFSEKNQQPLRLKINHQL